MLNYDIDLGLQSSNAVAAHSRGQYNEFLDKSLLYFQAVQTRYKPMRVPTREEFDFNSRLTPAARDGLVLITQQVAQRHNSKLPTSAPMKFEKSTAAVTLIERIRSERRDPTMEESLSLVQALFDTSAADYCLPSAKYKM
jgi:hypothetical protein